MNSLHPFIQKLLFYTSLMSLVVLFSCSDDGGTVTPPEEIKFVSQTKVGSYTAANLNLMALLLEFDAKAKYDVDIYEVTYYTTTKNEAPLLCSGLICIPKTSDNLSGVVAWQHGTIFSNSEVDDEKEAMAFMASLGHIVAGNNYIGLGTSNGEIQAYHIEQYAASDCITLLQATAQYISDNNILTNKDLQLIGYSQGGYNVVATQKAWEKKNYTFLNLKEVYTGDAALILTDALKSFFANESNDNTSFVPPFIMGYNFYYDMNMDYNSIYKSEYAYTVDNYYDGTKTRATIQVFLPKQLDQLFTTEFINSMKNGTTSLYDKLTNNNLTAFSPKNKLYIFHSKGDDIVPYSIGQAAYEYYVSVGGNVEFHDAPKNSKHIDTYMDFLKFVLEKFTTAQAIAA